MKTAIEAFAEEQYDISVATRQKADVDAFIRHLRSEQLRHELARPEGVIMCSEFTELAATMKCEEQPEQRIALISVNQIR